MLRLLIFCKRYPQGRDLFTQPYGRFYHLPRLLAERGHEVHLLLLSYKKDPEESRHEGNLHWYTVSARPWGPSKYVSKAGRFAAILKPDWLVGFSDTWYGILAEHIASAHDIRSLIDAYDNYESYIHWAKPLHWLWRRALARADAVTAAGPQLAEWMCHTSGRPSVDVMPMAADPAFIPLPKSECRERLGLPVDRILVGYSGALYPNRGIELVFAVLERLHAFRPVELVLSGRLAKGITLPTGVHWLGYRPPEDVPFILNSLNLMSVINKPGAFGNFSYPAKLYEAIACGVPVVAADVPGTRWVLRDRPWALAKAGDVEDFVLKALDVLGRESPARDQSGGWEKPADILEQVLMCGK